MIEGKKISYDDLIKLYSDKCEYCEGLEERLVEQNKKNDKLHNQVDVMSKKVKCIKDKYEELYKYAENLCSIIDERDEDIKRLIDVNEGLIKVNEQLQNNLKTKAVSQISILEVLRHL